MPQDLFISKERLIGESHPCFIIAEIGQNHQGSLDTAKELIRAAKKCGVDCVKFQKSCIEEKFTESARSTPYVSPHSWGKTYGEHKRFLEFSENEFKELYSFALSLGLFFSASAMDDISLEFLFNLGVPFIKIGSGDNGNYFLLEKAAALNIPLIISTGMQDMEGVVTVYELIKKYHNKFALLYCVSSYPTPPEDIDLNVIGTFKKSFPDINIGYSGHEISTNISLAAVARGAKILERHLTLDKRWKGTDHSCSLEPHEFRQLVSAIREIEQCFRTGIKELKSSEEACLMKLGKSLVAAEDLNNGDIIDKHKVKIKVSKPHGIPAGSVFLALGLKVKNSILRDHPIRWSDVC